MNYKLLGYSGLRVSELCLGTMTFGEDWGWGSSKEDSKKVFDMYAEAGGNFIDTANLYTNGTSEEYVGDFIRADRGHFVLATKYTLSMRDGDPNFSGNHRKNMVQSIEASLKRLGTDYIDLFWMHAWDRFTPVEEVMRAMDDLVRSGKVLYLGISDTPAWWTAGANMLADLRGWTQFVGQQIEYSLIERTPERDLLPMSDYYGLSTLAWGPLASGVLTGKYLDGDASKGRVKEGHSRLKGRNREIAQAVVDVSKEVDASPAQIALAWLVQAHESVIPILGARTLEQLEDNLGCLEVELSADHLDRLDQVSQIDPGFPHSFLDNPPVRKRIYGGTFDQIDL